MSSQRSAKPTKPPNQTTPSRSSSASSSSSVSSHLAMIELKQRILTSLSKLADRDTHQIAVEDLEKIIQSLSNDGVSMLLNCLYDAVNDPKPAVKKEGIRLLAALCAAHTDPAATHLTKIIAHIVKRLKDSDSQVRDACRDAIGSLAGLYLKGGNGGDGVVSLFVKPLFEVMSENNKSAQCGASMCLAKMVECASDPPLATFQKLCPRVCKFLNSPNFFAKASLLQVVSSLSQAGAISPQNLEPLLQRIHECLGSSDWATRKAAAGALSSLASNLSNITPEGATPTLTVLEACRFDKIKPVRESMTEALQLWKRIAGKGDVSSTEHKASSHDGEASEPAGSSDRKDLPNLGEKGSEKSEKNSSSGSSPTDSNTKGNGNNISDEAVGILRKKVPPALTDKELNPEFFHKLETRGSGDLPVEVVVPRRYANPSHSQNEKDPETNDTDPSRTMLNGQAQGYESIKKGTIGDRIDPNQREFSGVYADFSRNESDGLVNNKGNWLAIQRQLLQLERQQAHLMNMLQDFMGGSHDSMVTLESRVRGLERVVEDMARDLSISTGRRGGSFMAGFEGSSNRPLSKYSGFPDYSGAKSGRGNDGRIHFGERFAAFDGVASGMRGRGPSWRSDASDAWDFHPYSKNGQMGSRRTAGAGTMDIRSSKSDNEADQVGSRRAWEKGGGPVRFGEGPSARSVWQASKDEATLEAIRVAGEDNGVARNARVAIPEMTAEALGDNGSVPERDPVWTSWSNAMDALHVGDMDSAFAEVLSTGDDLLLVKLMDKAGPIIDQLSDEVATEVLHAVSQLLMEQNFFEMCLYWVQQLADIVMENGPDVLGIPMEVKTEILENLHEAASSLELTEEWDGSPPDQLLLQLASAWEIDPQHLGK
ncbi:microtubule-associated protein TORTIFOLIA1 [Sesamum indicum]|uniref:Microtubule-associated protein TORTIFOLIA1 n=1 Tax=Sesamum indicum TaxID=4182 RepID=A0A6I9U7P5_SESIN|nr:microtubule-associated protein TORTIFOLIA1 [Sesamum indicum]